MHDVGKTFDLHETLQGDGAGSGYPPKIIAPEVNQHDMLGLFFGVLQEVVAEQRVLGFVGATGPGSGDGAEAQPVGVASDEHFGGRTEQRSVRQAHVKHVGGGIDAA